MAALPQRLTDSADLAEAEATVRSVFASLDPFNSPFHDAVRRRSLLYEPVTQLSAEHLGAMQRAASATGSEPVLVLLTEDEVGLSEPSIWKAVIGPELYLQLQQDQRWLPGLEHAVVAADGRWGILMSHESHGLVGGTEAFMDALSAQLDLAAELGELADAIADDLRDPRVDGSWLPALARHVLQPNEADAFLERAQNRTGSQ